MESKSLKVIQVFAKIGKIVSKVIRICALVGAIACTVGLGSVLSIGIPVFVFNGTSLKTIVSENLPFSLGSFYGGGVYAIAACVSAVIICSFAERYFRYELEAGTPFTKEGSKELIRLGIITAAVPVLAYGTAEIVYCFMNMWVSNIEKVGFEGYNQVGLGLALVVLGFVCSYGADVIANKGKSINE